MNPDKIICLTPIANQGKVELSKHKPRSQKCLDT